MDKNQRGKPIISPSMRAVIGIRPETVKSSLLQDIRTPSTEALTDGRICSQADFREPYSEMSPDRVRPQQGRGPTGIRLLDHESGARVS
jgi:hypothetical protein